MNREEKAELIKKLNSTFNNAGVVVVTHQSGLTVEESTDLRVKMREVGARYQVAKNRIVKLALKDTKYENIIDLNLYLESYHTCLILHHIHFLLFVR